MNVQVKANRPIVDGTTEVRMNAVFDVGEIFPKWDAFHLLKFHHKGLLTIDSRDLPKVEKQFEADKKKASK